MLNVIKVDDLPLPWWKIIEQLFDLVFRQVEWLFYRVLNDVVIGDENRIIQFVVAKKDVAPILVIDAIAKGNKEITFNIVNIFELVFSGEEFDKDIMNAILQQFSVGGKPRTECKKIVDILVI